MKGKKVLKYFISILLIAVCCVIVKAQERSDRIIGYEETVVFIDSIAKLVEANYISEEIGRSVGKYIKARQTKGIYRNLSFKQFGRVLTEDLRTASGDIHMSAFYKELKERRKENFLDYKLGEYGESSNYGFVETKILRPNLGYLKIAHFTSPEYFQEAKKAVDHAMASLQHADALIIDVRNNPGGFEEIVAYFASYFFDSEPIYLQEYYARYIDRKRSISTTNDLPGKKLPNLPVYILTNKNTGSAAESFAYIMKHLERAQLIGATTAGAGNGSNYFRVSNEFMLQVATWETINNITKTSWEKVGVVPTIKTTSEMALDTAIVLAKLAAEEHQLQKINTYKKLLSNMDEVLKKDQRYATDELIANSIIACHQEKLINENHINAIGYDFMREQKKVKVAVAILKTNTILYPKSPNVYDSYAEALVLNGDQQLALFNYTKAVALAKENGNANLALFIENLEKLKNEILEKQ